MSLHVHSMVFKFRSWGYEPYFKVHVDQLNISLCFNWLSGNQFYSLILLGTRKVTQTTVMKVDIVPVTRDTECGFCYARLAEMHDPRALPCGHTQCTDCIEIN